MAKQQKFQVLPLVLFQAFLLLCFTPAAVETAGAIVVKIDRNETLQTNTKSLEKKREIKRIVLADLRQMALESKDALWQQARSKDRDVKLYLHWTEKHYGQFFGAYHLNIDADGSLYASTEALSEIKGHTYMRNTGSIGIALTCGERATFSDLGKEPPTIQQIESMAEVIAVLTQTFSIPIDKNHVMTHGEAGDNIDRFFPPYADNGRPYGMYGQDHTRERWDLAILKNGDSWGSGGDILRAKAKRYLKELQST